MKIKDGDKWEDLKQIYYYFKEPMSEIDTVLVSIKDRLYTTLTHVTQIEFALDEQLQVLKDLQNKSKIKEPKNEDPDEDSV